MPQKISIESVARYPLPGMAIPTNLKFSPDNDWITFLSSEDGSLNAQLYRLHLESGKKEKIADAPKLGATEENISLEETLRRERARMRTLGITQYRINKQGQILIPLPAGLFLLNQPGDDLQLLVSSQAGAIQNGRFSPDGRWITFVQNSEIHFIATSGGAPKQLTHGAAAQGKTNGLAEYIAQEEMGRSQGFWWSPNNQSIAFVEVDETHIPIYRIVHQGKDKVGAGAEEDHRYPFAGQPNARVRLGVIKLDGSDPVWMDLGSHEDFYLARVAWAEDRLLAQRLNREQSQLDLICFDPETGEATLLLEERSEVWINLHNHFRVLDVSSDLPQGGFIWASEKTGFLHLYLMNWQGEEIRPLTSGQWMVDDLVGVDQKNQFIYFTATKEDVTEKHLYRVSLGNDEMVKLSQAPGMHQIIMNRASGKYIDIWSNKESPPEIRLHSLDRNETPRLLFKSEDPQLETLELSPPEIVSLPNRHGDTLFGAIYRPPAEFGPGPYPTLVSVYGGPHAQRVTNQWGLTVDMRAQYLSQNGFLIFKLDNRGSARRGLAFEGVIKHDMGNLEVEDQVDGVHWLAQQGLADLERVGIYGWSYGGYMALMALVRAGDLFKAAVSGAPVTHWDGYDTCYTERYMGLPKSNPDGYRVSSVMHHVEKLAGKLMIIHGLIDENVHFRHTARLINALIKARKPYDLRLFPDERHVPRGLEDRIYMEEQVRDFFLTHL